jgi:hypothetical protein
MASIWDLMPASLWPTQPFVSPEEQKKTLQALQDLQVPWDWSSPLAIHTAPRDVAVPPSMPPHELSSATRGRGDDSWSTLGSRGLDTAQGLFGAPLPTSADAYSRDMSQSGGILGAVLGSKAITDVPREVKQTLADQWDAFKHHAWINQRERFDRYLANPTYDNAPSTWENFKDTGRAILDAASLPFAPVQGAARSLIGHPFADLTHLVGSYVAPETAAKDDPGKLYEDARHGVDLALMGLGPRGGMARVPTQPVMRALPPPARPLAGEGGGAPPIDAGTVPSAPNPAAPASELLRSPSLPLSALTDPRENPAIPIPPSKAISPFRYSAEGENFFHYGYVDQAKLFLQGLRPGGYATSIGTLSGPEAQAGLALPHLKPPNAVYPITPAPGTALIVNPVTRPKFGLPGGLPEFQFPFGTGPGTVAPPTPVSQK